jgi:mRNA interferase YafQ
MRTIRRTTAFKRDYKREKRGRHHGTLDADLEQVINLLAAGTPLPERFQDHPMRSTGGRQRNCHVRPDLVMIYSRQDPRYLDLVRLGSHSELGV